MISRIHGTLLVRELDRVEVLTAGGVAYEIAVPIPTVERLPRVGEAVELRIFQVVREDAILLFGFLEEAERTVFGRLLGAQGVGPRLALALLSSLAAERLVQAVRSRNGAALTAVSGVGKKTAERLILDLSGKFDDVVFPSVPGAPDGVGIDEAVRALTVLGFATSDAERAVREVVREEGTANTQELIRLALARIR